MYLWADREALRRCTYLGYVYNLRLGQARCVSIWDVNVEPQSAGPAVPVRPPSGPDGTRPTTGTLPATAVVVVAARAPRTRRDHEVSWNVCDNERDTCKTFLRKRYRHVIAMSRVLMARTQWCVGSASVKWPDVGMRARYLAVIEVHTASVVAARE